MFVRNRLREIRDERGISAVELAGRVKVSRQTIYAIEDGSFVPNTTVSLRLARALDITIEEIFAIEEEEPAQLLRAELLTNDALEQTPFVRLCRVKERLVAVPTPFRSPFLPIADGVVQSRKGRHVVLQAPTKPPGIGHRLVLAGCDPALSLLQDALHVSGIDIVAVSCGSRRALHWLKQGRVHAAGSHLLDRASGTYNVPIIRRLLPNAQIRMVTFATWEQGFVVPRGNPKGIRTVADLARKNVKVINREEGSGSKDLLDAGLRQVGIPTGRIKGYDFVADGHLAAAQAVASGLADCCIAPRSASRYFELDFVSLAVERFDITFPEASLELPSAKAVLDLLNRSHFRRKLEGLAGYDTVHTGEVLV